MARLLDGVRILDLTRMLAGPFGTQVLADLGAEVIKIEDPRRGGDEMRHMAAPAAGETNAYFLAINRNKKSVAIDLKSRDGREVFDRLVRTADVVTDNFRPGVMARIGASPRRLRRVNPRVITCSLTSYGDDDPAWNLPAFDLVIQAISGAMSVTGEAGRMPVRLGVPLGDLAGGSFLATSIAAALHRRARRGKGFHLSLTLLDSLVAFLTYVAQYHLADGRVPGPQGSRHMTIVPYGVFATTTDPIAVAVFVERFWEGFCRALDRPRWIDDARFRTNTLRVRHRRGLEREIARILRRRAADAWLERLRGEGVPSAPVLPLDRALRLEPLRRRGMVTTVPAGGGARVETLGRAARVAGEKPRPLRRPPRLGEHTTRLLREAGVPPARLRELRRRGVIAGA